MKNPRRTFSLPKPLTSLLEALPFAVAVASRSPLGAVAVAPRYPKASALGLSGPHKEGGFSPWGRLSSLSHNFQWAKEQ
jgi:hypothetical protein